LLLAIAHKSLSFSSTCGNNSYTTLYGFVCRNSLCKICKRVWYIGLGNLI